MIKESLKFENGKFVYSSPKIGKYETVDLRTARIYRKFADEKCERIFRKRFQEFYDLKDRFSIRYVKGLKEIDPHQQRGIEWILTRKRSYLAHAPGAGKTATAIISSCFSQAQGQVLFIVPPSLTKNWEREIWKFTDWVNIFPTIGMVGTTAKRNRVAWNADFIIVPDSMLTKEWVYEELQKRKWKFIAVDEASRFKEITSERSVALFGGRVSGRLYPGLIRDSRYVVLLDGSPMPNRPIELWGPVFAMDPESIDCMDYDDFGYRYCGAKPNAYGLWEYKYSSHEAELKEKLQKSFMQVVTESELSHPERRRSMVVMNEDVRSLEHRKWERLKVPDAWTFNEDQSQGEVARFRKELGIRKVPWIARHVKERLEKDESILLFVWHREVAEQLAEAIGKEGVLSGIIYGGCSPVLRENMIDRFQKGLDKLLIMNIAAAGRGHNLQRADRVIFGEFSWTDETNKQAEKRASRKGSEKEFVRCEYIVCPNSMDEMVLNSVFTKEGRVRRIVG